MGFCHAVVFVDHHNAQVVQFGTEQADEHQLHEPLSLTRQHASGVRSEHEFFGQVCDALEGIIRVLITGARQALADFQHFVDKHRPQTARHIAGYEVVGHPSVNEMVVIACNYFVQIDLTAGTPVLP